METTTFFGNLKIHFLQVNTFDSVWKSGFRKQNISKKCYFSAYVFCQCLLDQYKHIWARMIGFGLPFRNIKKKYLTHPWRDQNLGLHMSVPKDNTFQICKNLWKIHWKWSRSGKWSGKWWKWSPKMGKIDQIWMKTFQECQFSYFL